MSISMGIVFSTPSDMAARSFDSLQSKIQTPFFACKLVSQFCEVSTFSSCDFGVELHEVGTADSRTVAISFSDLFDVDLKTEDDDAVKFIYRCSEIEWPCRKSFGFVESERTILIDVCTNILLPLCNEVILDWRYKESLSITQQHLPTLTCGAIGLGTLETWHGTPDGRVREGEVHLLCSKTDEGDAGSDEESNGIGFKGKISISKADLPRVVAMSVVSAFTEHNLHPDMSAMVPCILFGKNQFRVCLYHCERDILLLSSEILLSTRSHLSQSAMALLWAVLNHRRFLVEPPPNVDNYTAGIKSRLERGNKLQHFTALSNKTVSWYMPKEALTFDCEDVPICLMSHPIKKKVQ